MFSRLEKRMAERQQHFEHQLNCYAQELTTMKTQVTTLEQQVLQLLQTQFSKLASAITNTLQLTQEQTATLHNIVDDHLHELAITTQLQLPKGPFRLPPPQQQGTTYQATEEAASTQRHNRDPRLASTRARTAM